MGGASYIDTSSVKPDKNWAKGHEEVVRMHYEIGVGTMDSWPFWVYKLADTESFKDGISLSEIKWAFNQTSHQQNSGRLEFTLHDIAGQMLPKFIEIKKALSILYFKGPDSYGNLWVGPYAPYRVLADDCDLQFSPTQGFTYTFVAEPVNKLVDSKYLGAHSKISINGVKDNVSHTNTFEDYLKEIAHKWNESLNNDNPGRAAKASIEFYIDTSSGINAAMAAQTPFLTVNHKEGDTMSHTGNAATPIEQFDITPGRPIAESVIELWQTRFAPSETSSSKDINAGSMLEVNFKDYIGGKTIIDVKLHKKAQTDKVTGSMIGQTVCIGDDVNCKGYHFRASMVGLDFKELINLINVDNVTTTKDDTPNTEVFISGTNEMVSSDAEKTRDIDGETQSKDNVTDSPLPAGLPSSHNPAFDGWNGLGTLLNKHHNAEMSIDIEMPYTYGFTPVVFGGMIRDSIDGKTSGGIHPEEGVFLQFYWYTDVHCDTLALVSQISKFYRIMEVTHSIGLNGHNTQVKLSHQNVSKG